MSTHKILADETVAVSELRKNPSLYFTDHAIAVMSHNQPTGYVIGAKAYEAIVAILMQLEENSPFDGQFQPTAKRIQEITQRGAELLANAEDDMLNEFTET